MTNVDPSVIQAIASAVEAAPENRALRLHLAELLVDANRAAEALPHCARLLQDVPDDLAVLRIATRAAERSGDATRASSYRRLLAALEPQTEPAPEKAADVVKLRVIQGGDAIEADVERPAVKLADVAGMEHVKQRLELAFLAPMRNPEITGARSARACESRGTSDVDVDVDWIVTKTNGYSGADVVHLCDSAAELAMADSIASGNVRAVTTEDFKRASAADADPAARRRSASEHAQLRTVRE